MSAVFVHGVPDTQRVWSRVLARLGRRDVVTLSLPGFGRATLPGFEWHQAARLWQTPEVGERVMESLTAPGLQKILVTAGVPEADAEETARHVDGTMKRCILTLDRSAVHVGSEWADDLRRITAPGLVLWGEVDPYAALRFGARLAERTRARFVCLPGCSHWWQLERPDTVADELQRFWKEARDG